jgi:hypothetical protein
VALGDRRVVVVLPLGHGGLGTVENIAQQQHPPGLGTVALEIVEGSLEFAL